VICDTEKKLLALQFRGVFVGVSCKKNLLIFAAWLELWFHFLFNWPIFGRLLRVKSGPPKSP